MSKDRAQNDPKTPVMVLSSEQSASLLQNRLLAAVMSDEAMLSYIQQTHVTQIKEDVISALKPFIQQLPIDQKFKIYKMLHHGS